MPLFNSANLMAYLQTYRVLWFRSRYGSGKTALAFRLAYQLKQEGYIRYILSNCHSPIVDQVSDVVLREGRYADVVLVMDEAGKFMRNVHKADMYMDYMRKLNIVLLMPSVRPPSMVMRSFWIKRIMNLEVIGLPLWVYKFRLTDVDELMSENVYWLRPSEIYGLYDTAGFPSEGEEIERAIGEWAAQAARSLNYKAPIPGGGGFTVIDDSDGLGVMEALRGVAETIEESTAAQSDTVSLLLNSGRKKRGR